MRSVWFIACVMAVTNVLLLLGLLGWLMATGRVSEDRLREVRELFDETVAAEQTRLEAERLEAEEAAERERAAALPALPYGSGERNVLRRELGEADLQRYERLRREAADLQRAASLAVEQLRAREEALAAREAAFEAMRGEIAEIEGAEQFKKVVGVLEGLKPDQAKQALLELLEQGEQAQAVAYLDAMAPRARTKVIAEFVKDEQSALAADLLESLRTRGLALADPEEPSG